MRIIFGHNSYVVKRINSKSLGIINETESFEIQLRQKYAHLYYIPVFPIGQVWVAQRNGNLYDVPENLKPILKRDYPSSVHWGAFALPLLIVLGLIIMEIYAKIEHMNYENQRQTESIANGNNLKSALQTITNKNTLLSFSTDDSDIDTYGNYLFVVLKVEKDKLLIGSISGKKDNWPRNFVSNRMINEYRKFKDNGISETFWISRKELENAIKLDEDFTSKLIPKISSTEKICLHAIYFINDAYFDEDTNANAQTEFYKEYINFGLDVVLDSIVPDKKGEEWKLSQKKEIKFGEKFAIKTESNDSAKLYYHIANEKKSLVANVTRYDIDNNLKDD
ncbi:MAG: hypothetical protein QM535_07935 [Limnohabitans sp.]|nr:hypothetical protein [Limnohabitans sp.]